MQYLRGVFLIKYGPADLHHAVYPFNCSHDRSTLLIWYERQFALGLLLYLIRYHSDYEIITERGCTLYHVEMPHMKKVERALQIARVIFLFVRLCRNFSLQRG